MHVCQTHLHPLFLREVPCAPGITQARKAVLDWLRIRLVGPGTSLLEMSAWVPAGEVFTSPAEIPDDIREAMDALCREVGEEPPSTYALEGDLHPALLLHWRVQAYLVGHLDPESRREYRALMLGLRVNGRPLRCFTMNPGPPPQLPRVVVVEGWAPEAPLVPPPEEAKPEAGQEAQPEAGQEAEQEAEPEGAQAPQPGGQEHARGAYPPPGIITGEMMTLDLGPMATGPRRVHWPSCMSGRWPDSFPAAPPPYEDMDCPWIIP